jgi:hypothetical protein
MTHMDEGNAENAGAILCPCTYSALIFTALV